MLTLAERRAIARRWFRRLWCALRDHPYPVETPPHEDDDPMILWALSRCSHCGVEFRPRRRGMHS